jgi:hypothetical protein
LLWVVVVLSYYSFLDYFKQSKTKDGQWIQF